MEAFFSSETSALQQQGGPEIQIASAYLICHVIYVQGVPPK